MEIDTLRQTNISERFERRQVILDFEKALSRVPGAIFGDSDNAPLKHTFTDGFYVRQITIPKGTLTTGKIHKHPHPSFLLSGEVSVFTEENGIERLKAPQSMISAAGTKRIVYAHEDTVWVTVHLNPSNTKRLDELENMIIAKDYSQLPCGIIEAEQIKELE